MPPADAGIIARDGIPVPCNQTAIRGVIQSFTDHYVVGTRSIITRTSQFIIPHDQVSQAIGVPIGRAGAVHNAYIHTTEGYIVFVSGDVLEQRFELPNPGL